MDKLHWTQRPENKDKVVNAAKKGASKRLQNQPGKPTHWTQTQEGRQRMREIAIQSNNASHARLAKLRLSKSIVTSAKRDSIKKTNHKPKETVLVINGWRVILGKHEVRLDNE